MWKPNGFVAFNAEFRNGIETVNNTGVVLSDIVLIDAYQNGLNNTVFADVKRDMKIPSRKAGYPTRLEDFIFEMEQVQNRFNTDGKSPYDADSTRVLKADTKGSGDEKKHDGGHGGSRKGGGRDAKKPSHSKCIYCEKHHPGDCWDEAAISRYYEAETKA